MTDKVLTIVLKGDGSGLTGTVRVAESDMRRLGAALDAVGENSTGMGAASRRSARDVDALSASQRRAELSSRSLALGVNTLRNTLGALGITYVTREFIEAGLNMDRLERSMAAALGSQHLAGQEMAFVREQAERLGIYMPTLAQGYVGLAAATRGTVLAGEQTRQIFLAVAESGRAMNLSNDQIAGTLTALQQIAGKGTVSMEELRQQLGDRLPGAMQIAARSMDMTVADFVKMVAQGKILASDFLPKFAAEMRESAAAGVELARSSPTAEFQRLKTALFDLAAAVSRGGTLQVLAAAAGSVARNMTALATAIGVVGVALVGAFASRQLARVTDYAAGVLQVRQALAQAATASVAKAQATAADTAATLAALQAARQQALAELSLANAEIATARQTIQATQATSFLSASRRTAEIATEKLRAAEVRRNAALSSLATLGQQQARTELAAASAAVQLETAQRRLNATQLTAMNVVRGLGRGVASLGSGLLSLAGGPIGIVITGIGLLAAAMVKASADARQLKQDVADAITASQLFQGTQDLDDALSAGKALLATKQALEQSIANRQANLDTLRFNPIARSTSIYANRQEELRKDQAQLAEVNRQLALNRPLIEQATAALAANRAALQNGTKESADFNDQLSKQNEKLVVERIEREKGVRAALEYQAMQAAGVTSVDKLSQATLDLIDTQVREVSAADAYKKAQKDAADAAREADRATKEQRESQARYAEALEEGRAELAGPVAKAQAEHDIAIRKLDADLAKHNITLATYNGLVEIEDQKLEATTAAIAAKQDILGQIQADYADQIRLSGLTGEAYRVEAELQRRLNDARQQHVTITPELVDSYREEIAWGERQTEIADAAARAADDFTQSWLNAVQSVGRALGDWLTGTISSLGDLRDALVDIGKRWFSDRFSQGFTQLLNGGFAGAGSMPAGGGIFSTVLGGLGRLLGFGGGMPAATAAGGGWVGLGTAAGGVFSPAGAAAAAGYGTAGAANGYGGALLSGAGAFQQGTLGKFLTSPAAPWLGAAAGALYGWQKGGDTPGKALGAAAYGTAAYGLATGVGAGLTASAAGAGVGAAGAAGLAAIPVVGWVALAAIAVNAISGGKLFGTKYKLDSASNNFTYGDDGFGGTQSVTKVKQQSLFRGRKWSTSTSALSEEAQAAMDQAFQAINSAVTQAAVQLGISAPDLLGASFKQEFDSKGNLKSEFGTIAGRVYKEAQDAFNQRYLAENLLNVAGLASGHAATIQQLASPFRSSPEALTDFATLMLAIAGDAKAGKLLWDDTDAALQRAVGTLGDLRHAGESLAETYKRVSEAAHAYGDLIGGVRAELLTHGLSDYAQAQLQVEQQYRAQVKQANDLAKALGLSGARAEDLASIEQLRAQRMADLQLQMEKQRDEFLGNLRLSDLAPGTDQDKLTDAMQQLRTAVAGGDLQRAQQLAQSALGFGRNLYASGTDYNALYGTVTSLLDDLDPVTAGLTADALQQLADTMETLPNDIASALFALLAQPAPLPPPPAGSAAPVTPAGGDATGTTSSASSGSSAAALAAIAANTAATAAATDELLRQQKRADLAAANTKVPA